MNKRFLGYVVIQHNCYSIWQEYPPKDNMVELRALPTISLNCREVDYYHLRAAEDAIQRICAENDPNYIEAV